jgi:beta-lactamase class D
MLCLAPIAALLLAGCTHMPTPAPLSVEAAQGCEHLLDALRSTFLLHEVRTGRTIVCNPDRAEQRLTPASTFKIAHALIALETGVVEDETQRFAWDGLARGVRAWDRDTSLAEAMAPSTVWVFQAIADRIGAEREAAWVSQLDYGNADSGSAAQLRTFWLSGPLAISADEQVRFLTHLRAGTLDASQKNQQRVAAMIRLRDCGPGCSVHGKTGAVLPIDNTGQLRSGANELLPSEGRTGWFVGWVERPNDAGGAVVFAYNVDLDVPNAMATRTEVAYAVLTANGVQTAATR